MGTGARGSERGRDVSKRWVENGEQDGALPVQGVNTDWGVWGCLVELVCNLEIHLFCKRIFIYFSNTKLLHTE